MENTQLSLVNALFNGKSAADKLSLSKMLPSQEEAQKDPEGFFAFIQDLLKAVPGAELPVGEESVNPANGSLQNFYSALESQLSGAADGDISTPNLTGDGNTVAPGATTNATPVIAGVVEVLSSEAASSNVARVAPAGKPDVGISQPVDALTGGVNQASGPALAQGQAAAIQKASTGPATDQDQFTKIENTLGDPSDGEAPNELRGRENGRIGDGGPTNTTSNLPGFAVAAKANSNAMAAITDFAAPEALSHSALTRSDTTGGVEFDRIASSRLEAAVNGAERNAHLNPVRDQIIAAVAMRQGEGKLEIRLDPPELGRVMIGFEGNGTDIVRAVITADSPETLDLMRRNADVFQRALEEQGFENLDLQFADKGASDDAQEDASEASSAFSVTEEDLIAAGAQMPDSQALGSQVGYGRLDRRL